MKDSDNGLWKKFDRIVDNDYNLSASIMWKKKIKISDIKSCE